MNGRQIYQNTKSCRQVQLSSGVAARVTVSTTSSSAYPGYRAQVGLPSFGYRAHVGPPPAAAAHILDTEYRYDRHLLDTEHRYGCRLGYRAQVWRPSWIQSTGMAAVWDTERR